MDINGRIYEPLSQVVTYIKDINRVSSWRILPISVTCRKIGIPKDWIYFTTDG